MMIIKEKQYEAMLNAIICTSILIESIDVLQETYLFKQDLKHKAKAFLKELERVIKTFYDLEGKVNKIDWEAESQYYELIKHSEKLLKEFKEFILQKNSDYEN